ncbi:MAG: Rieske (2Fe-2S) protein [Flavobacteriales bacterium]|nr:Rieske (2Fe-2S) protein [Flavobacteriales bacterium]
MIVERTRWHRLPLTSHGDNVPAGPLRVRIAGRDLCLVRSDDGWYALADRCPHQGKPLSGGWCEGHHLICPWHRFAFDVRTGASIHGTTVNVEVFNTEQREGAWYVGIPYTTIRILGFDLW